MQDLLQSAVIRLRPVRLEGGPPLGDGLCEAWCGVPEGLSVDLVDGLPGDAEAAGAAHGGVCHPGPAFVRAEEPLRNVNHIQGAQCFPLQGGQVGEGVAG